MGENPIKRGVVTLAPTRADMPEYVLSSPFNRELVIKIPDLRVADIHETADASIRDALEAARPGETVVIDLSASSDIPEVISRTLADIRPDFRRRNVVLKFMVNADAFPMHTSRLE